jgi:CO dehydrogenase nickel-insertion accessory protein CooC1
MKIAVLGKGGSGKSSLSWALAQYISTHQHKKTLAIDGDHNMDLTSCLGVDYENMRLFKEFGPELRELAGMPQIGPWRNYLAHNPISLSYPGSPELEKYVTKINTNLDLINVGLGDESVMMGNMCSHGLSAPIKYVTPSLSLDQKSAIVFDSVAGADLVNYGLYFGFDVLCIVVEPYRNSIRVAKQIKDLLDKQEIDSVFVLNKYSENNVQFGDFEKEFEDNIVGKIPNDDAISSYSFMDLQDTTVAALENIYSSIKDYSVTNPYQKLKDFEANKSLQVVTN